MYVEHPHHVTCHDSLCEPRIPLHLHDGMDTFLNTPKWRVRRVWKMIWLSKVSCHLLAYQVAPVSYLDLRGVQAGEQSAGDCLHFPDPHMKLKTFKPETSPVLLAS